MPDDPEVESGNHIETIVDGGAGLRKEAVTAIPDAPLPVIDADAGDLVLVTGTILDIPDRHTEEDVALDPDLTRPSHAHIADTPETHPEAGGDEVLPIPGHAPSPPSPVNYVQEKSVSVRNNQRQPLKYGMASSGSIVHL